MIYSLVSEQDITTMLNVAASTPPGCFVEVGVYKGGTAYFLNELCKVQTRSLWLFDTFTGMPEKTEGVDRHNVGDFSDCSLEKVKKLIPTAHFFPGVFPDSMPRVLPRIAFAHIDCDQYETIKQCIRHLGPLMVPSGIMYFDDYSHLEGAKSAVDEFCPKRVVLDNHKAIAIFNDTVKINFKGVRHERISERSEAPGRSMSRPGSP